MQDALLLDQKGLIVHLLIMRISAQKCNVLAKKRNKTSQWDCVQRENVHLKSLILIPFMFQKFQIVVQCNKKCM